MNLIEALQTVPDYRKARGKRHLLWIILVFIVMGKLAGYRGNRPLEEFAQRYVQRWPAYCNIGLIFPLDKRAISTVQVVIVLS
ncbi:transposase family protein [Phormidium tenue]|uniref:H repeat-associated protein N-terminal domain-containing protein n=1 Tax=Phormidium tenue NIES-30 TaxID=549789 RepID=A0A1U7J646_9CYAN|nr:transposase family protein [Phormidium tenue]MBD2232097.1 transposase family protein [Phormidium tenue FACHB-1052]OKH48316.1 hypothetical protein NIES30_09775 [Phormidium tenue NIES-30]